MKEDPATLTIPEYQRSGQPVLAVPVTNDPSAFAVRQLRTIAHILNQDHEFPRSERGHLGTLLSYLGTLTDGEASMGASYLQSVAKCLTQVPEGVSPADLTSLAMLMYHFLDMCTR